MLSKTRAALAAPILLLGGAGAALAAGPCDPLTHGALADGTTDNTVAIQAAIDACAQAGGGVVPFASGVFLTGPISLRSHVLLQVNKGATLRGTADQSRYTYAFIGYTYRANEALISAVNVTDTGIVGGGTIDGQGPVWWPAAIAAKNAVSAGATSYGPQYAGIPTTNGLPRPWLVEFYNASHVIVNGVTLTNSPMWNLALRYVNGASVSNYTVVNPPDSPNTDGVDVVSSNQVVLTNMSINTGDDNVAIKSGFPGFPTPAVPTTNLTVANSTFLRGHGLSIGSEADNGVQHVRAMNVTFNGTDNGIRIKTGRDRGSDISDLVYTNLTMTNVAAPISFSAYYPKIPAAGTDGPAPITPITPYVHDITVQNLTATGATSALIVGLPESPIRNVSLNHVSIQSTKTGLELRNMLGTFQNVAVSAAKGPGFVVEENVSVSGQTVP
jgi:polygalacturonase